MFASSTYMDALPVPMLNQVGSQVCFYRVQIEVKKDAILGPYKIDVGEAKSAIKDPHFGTPK